MPVPYFNTYQQSYAPYQPTQTVVPMQAPFIQQSQQQPSSTINWVQGEIGARAYPVGAGNSVLLMDSEGQNFYIKSADNTGMPTMKKYAYSEVVEEPLRLESKDNRDYDTAKLASREEVKQLQEEIRQLKNQIATMEVDARNQQSQSMSGGQVNGQPNL